MKADFAQNWIIYLLMAGFAIFVVYVAIKSRHQERIDKDASNKQDPSK